MYQVSMPISITTVNEDTMLDYLADLKACEASRVFFCGFGDVCSRDSILWQETERVRRIIDCFRKNGLEVGVWLSAFGHGIALSHEQEREGERYTQITGADGTVGTYANCPLDPDFQRDYVAAVRKLGEIGTDLIMLDDDFRLNVRCGYEMGCFCHRHLAAFYREIGEEIPREEIAKRIYTGGRNKYRSAYLRVTADSLLSFARMLRAALDEVAPHVRMGTCFTCESWDVGGTDPFEISAAFAGRTKPFGRTCGAPYYNIDIIPVIEATRQQFAWCEGGNIELFAEGDTYPRPRYRVPSRGVELFDLALIANQSGDGILNYLFDYCQKPDYERGYVRRYVRNRPHRKALEELFVGKRPIGVYHFNRLHKVEDYTLPETFEGKPALHLLSTCYASAFRNLLPKNSIPTTYTDKGEGPVCVAGENGKYVPTELLKRGAILDATAAIYLSARGIDTGILTAERTDLPKEEYFIEADESISGISHGGLRRITCKQEAKILSNFLPDGMPSAYLYENQEGMRFYVLACDLYNMTSNCENFHFNYHRQAQLIRACEWVSEKPLPAVCTKNPNLYILASRGNDGAMSVLLMNISIDEVLAPEVILDRAYARVKSANCQAALNGNTVTLSDISPYGFCAFEVR